MSCNCDDSCGKRGSAACCDNFKVLVVVPCKPSLPRALADKMLLAVNNLVLGAGVDCSLLLDRAPEKPLVTDRTPWVLQSRVRSKIINSGVWRDFSHLLWVDADIVFLPDKMLDQLLVHNSGGVCAPMVLIEGSSRHYDGSAYIQKGTSHIAPGDRQCDYPGRNFNPYPPYVPDFPEVLDVDSVGTITLVNCDVYRSGCNYEDHATFTDHWGICDRALGLGRRVTVSRDLVALHADLPKYGLAWH